MLARLRRVPFAAQVLLALVVGVALGLIARHMGPLGPEVPNWLTSTLQTVGGTFVTLLKVLVPPLIVTAVIVSIANLQQVSNAARLAGQTLLWFAITALIAVSIGIGLGLLTQPGRNPRSTPRPRPHPGRPAPGGLPHRPGAAQHPRPAGRTRRHGRPLLQRAAADRALRRDRYRGAQGRRAGRAVPRPRPVGADDRAEGVVVGHPPGAAGHGRPDRQRGRHLRLGVPRLARRLRRRRLRGSRAGAVRRLPGAAASARPLAAALLRRRVARDPAGVRVALVDRHPAGHRAGDRAEPRRPAVLRVLRRALRGDDEDGRLRRDLPGVWRRSSWRSSSASTCRSPTTC